MPAPIIVWGPSCPRAARTSASPIRLRLDRHDAPASQATQRTSTKECVLRREMAPDAYRRRFGVGMRRAAAFGQTIPSTTRPIGSIGGRADSRYALRKTSHGAGHSARMEPTPTRRSRDIPGSAGQAARRLMCLGSSGEDPAGCAGRATGSERARASSGEASPPSRAARTGDPARAAVEAPLTIAPGTVGRSIALRNPCARELGYSMMRTAFEA
ncbi:MAG: hypothetical protein JWO81_1199 [Alphaproteobacteria bacterium]|nr:hypothetical protein [Alphaproteobacteria bacterium]